MSDSSIKIQKNNKIKKKSIVIFNGVEDRFISAEILFIMKIGKGVVDLDGVSACFEIRIIF